MLQIGANPRILDLGCGIGVPTRYLAEQTDNEIWGIDADSVALDFFKNRIANRFKAAQITLLHGKFPEVLLDRHPKPLFDLIWAEGLLNVIGFEFGIGHILNYLDTSGIIVIHDEIPRMKEKMEHIQLLGLKLLDSFEVTPESWFKLYYEPLEMFVHNSIENGAASKTFESELHEIKEIIKKPDEAHSIFYIFRKEAQ